MNRLSTRPGQARLSDVSLSGFWLLCTRHGCVNWWDEVGLPVGGRVCLTFRTWSVVPLPPISSLFLLRTDTALSGSSRECEKTTLFTMNWREEDVGGWVGVTFRCHLQLTQSPKNAPHPSRMERGWSAAGKKRFSFLLAVCHFASSSSSSPDNENRKEKIYVPMLFCRVC